MTLPTTEKTPPETAETPEEQPLSEMEPLVDEDELVPEDDTIIGRAFRWSVAVIVAVGAVAGIAFFFLRPTPEVLPEAPIEVAAPLATRPAAEPPSFTFTDVTRAAGIRFVHHNGATGEKLLPETMGGGAAFFDYDGDLDPDLLLVNGADWPHERQTTPRPTMALYANDGKGHFTDVTVAAGLDVTFYGMGAAVGDFDGDDRIDVFFTAVGPNHLFHNLGGRFEEVTDHAGVAGSPAEWSTSAAFFDYDGDGDLDLFVGNYVRWSRDIDLEVNYRLTGIGRAYGPPLNYEGTYPYLYRNEGDGTFTDVSAEAGIRIDNPATGDPVAKSLGVTPVDADLDGHMDVVVANDTVQNFFFHNLGDGTFEETGELAGLAYDRNGAATGAMGIDAGYIRNDQDLGFFIGNFANEMTSVYVAQGDPTLFADESITEGIGAPSRTMLSFGLVLFDADLDGRLDLLQANGHLENDIADVDPSQSYRQAAQLFWNAGPDAARTFVPVPPATTGALGKPIVGRGVTYADIDGDGDLDVLLTQVAGSPLLLRNDQELGHHWLRLLLVGDDGNPHAIGARIDLTAGGVTQRRQVMTTRSYLSQVELPVTFGLGDTAVVDGLTVTWPDGTVQEVPEVEADQLMVVEKATG